VRIRGSIQIEYTLARLGAERLWNLMHTDRCVPALGAITGNQQAPSNEHTPEARA